MKAPLIEIQAREASFAREIILAAPVADVFEALDPSYGLPRWWPARRLGSEGPSREGTLFRLGPRGPALEIEEWRPFSRARWRRAENALEPGSMSGGEDPLLGEWIALSLSELPAWRTRLRLEAAFADGAAPLTAAAIAGWERFLACLERFAATGVGIPYGASAEKQLPIETPSQGSLPG